MAKRRRNRPESDWIHREVIDARSIYADGMTNCDFCGTRIRHIHILEHDDQDQAVEAGCCCAERYCNEYDAKGAEREFKKRADRRARFVNRDVWKESRNNPANIWRWVKLPGKKKRERVSVYTKDGGYGVFVEDCRHWNCYVTQGEAMNAAFELIDALKEEA